MKDSLGRETDHRTPCDEGQHSPRCTDKSCDCPCHGMGWMTQVDQYLQDTGPEASGDAR